MRKIVYCCCSFAAQRFALWQWQWQWHSPSLWKYEERELSTALDVWNMPYRALHTFGGYVCDLHRKLSNNLNLTTATTTTMRMRNNSERANWQLRHEIYERTNIKFAAFRNEHLNVCNASKTHTKDASTNRRDAKTDIDNSKFKYKRMRYCRIVSAMLPTDEQADKNKAG